MNRFLIVILISSAFFSCSKKSTTEPHLNEDIILGKWEWIKSETIWPDYQETTPATAGYTHHIKFLSDSQIKIFYADTLQNICEYIKVNNSITICNSRYSFEQKSDTLVLSQVETDGEIKYYKKL